jgi:hypothetical protein
LTAFIVIIIMELACKSEVIKDAKLNVIILLEDTTAEVGIIFDERVVEPVTVNEAEDKLNVMAEGKVSVIYPFALNLELTLYVIINMASLLLDVLFLLILKSPEAIVLDVAVIVKLLLTLLESSTGFNC